MKYLSPIPGISGGSGSGKSSVANKIIKVLGNWAVVLSLDSFYKSLSNEQIDAAVFSRPFLLYSFKTTTTLTLQTRLIMIL